MPRQEKIIIPGTNRYYMHLAKEKYRPSTATLTERVSILETFKEQIGSVVELKMRIQHLEDCVNSKQSKPCL